MKRTILALAGATMICAGSIAFAADDGDVATTVAALLARADAAASEPGARAQLRADLIALDRFGAHAADADDPRPQWRAAAKLDVDADYRGRVLGPAFRRGTIAPGGVARIEQQFLGGQRSSIAVSGVPGEGVTVSVRDPDDAAVCGGERAACSWLPLYTQRYTISIHNAAPHPARFYLVVD